MANIINERIEKIDKPKAGWTWKYLESFGFRFKLNKKIYTNWKKVLNILDISLPYFNFYTAVEQYYIKGFLESKNIKKIIIDDNILFEIAIESTKRNGCSFSKSILEYNGFPPEIVKQTEFDKVIQDEIKVKEVEEEEYNKNQEIFLKEKNKSNQLAINNKQGGIYGIYSLSSQNIKELLYIGLTNRPLIDRWTEHLNIIKDIKHVPNGMNNLYSILKTKIKSCELLIDIFVDFDTIQTNRPLTQSEKEAMECGFISALQPIGNTSGVKIPYRFSDVKI